MSATAEQLRLRLRQKLPETVLALNRALKGENINRLKPVLTRIGRGGELPHWFEQLRKKHVLPNMDGKTIGSVLEMLLVAVLEQYTFQGLDVPRLKINPARGIDLPDLELGVKSPSENYCTSEPFFSAYERLLGSDHDILVLLTDYQSAKKKPPLRLQVIKWEYLRATQVADQGLCTLARTQRDWLIDKNEAWAKKAFRFLAYVNQSDWRAKHLIRLVEMLNDEQMLRSRIEEVRMDFDRINGERKNRGTILLPETELDALSSILEKRPLHLGVIDAIDNWVVETHKDFGRLPNDNEWSRLRSGPLDGRIGMSYALQWRYNFGKLFGMQNGENCTTG